jgi:hypothetical protein
MAQVQGLLLQANSSCWEVLRSQPLAAQTRDLRKQGKGGDCVRHNMAIACQPFSAATGPSSPPPFPLLPHPERSGTATTSTTT